MPGTELNVGDRVMTTTNIVTILTGVLARGKGQTLATHYQNN